MEGNRLNLDALRQWSLRFDPQGYGAEVGAILALDQDGGRLIPLVSGRCSLDIARERIGVAQAALFAASAYPKEALAGLWLYFSCADECHQILQELDSAEASLWHAILHRQEPDSGNASYWFRRAGRHPVFNPLRDAAGEVLARYPDAGFHIGGAWDPYSFIAFCERAREEPGSSLESAALEVQRAEWQLLFDHCARART